MSLSEDTSDYIFHHVVLPPKLPQEDGNDKDIHNHIYSGSAASEVQIDDELKIIYLKPAQD